MDVKLHELLFECNKPCLYTVELLINRLNFNSETIINEINDKHSYLIINLTFLHLPTFIIKENNVILRNKKRNKLEIVDFSSAGVSYRFSMRSNYLSEMMKQREILKIAIYKMNINSNCQINHNNIDNVPICHTAIHFDGYLCDQFNMARGNCENLPLPFEVRKVYELLDTMKNPCGTIDLFTRISFCGTSIMTQFSHDEKSFLFKNVKSTNKFECLRLLSTRMKNVGVNTEIPEAKTIMGLSTLYQNLSNNIRSSGITSKMDEKRMRGGGLDNKNINPSMCPIQSMQTLLSGVCPTNNKDDDIPGCGCREKSGIESMRMTGGCTSKPCYGIDCLIRAFKDTQEFVDNIKVTGISGLGSMNPAESRYFGRNRDEYSTAIGREKTKPEEDISTPSKDINTSNDNSNSPNTIMLMQNNPQYNGKLMKNIVESIESNEEKVNSSSLDRDLYKLTKNNDKNSLKGIKNTSRSSIQLNKQSTKMLNKPKLTNVIYNRRTRKNIEKNYSQSQGKLIPKCGIKPSKRTMKLVRAAASRLHFGHKSCVDIRMRVPGNMGWLWNTRNTAADPKPQIGWKPGAISRRVWRLLKEAKVEKNEKFSVEQPITPMKINKSGSSRKPSGSLLEKHHKNEHDDDGELPPTLHIHRKNGTYYITVYPVKKEFFGQPEMQEDVRPLQFKVIKRERADDDDSFTSSSTASDMEFEFSPPTAITHYRTKVITKDGGTQVQREEIIDSINDPINKIQGTKYIN